MDKQIVAEIKNGEVYYTDRKEKIDALTWNEHPSFQGVFLKHLLTGKETGGAFSTHFVHIRKGCAIERHIHKGKWELHEVVDGQGECVIVEKTVQYQAGIMALIPPDMEHIVKAKTDLYILAKFIPALL